MFTKFLQIILAGLALTAASSALSSVWAQSVTVVEYYNKSLDAYFITGRVAEQQALDAAADFKRTGMTFSAVAATAAPAGATRVCRFYISSITPFISTHFYGLEGVDCESIRALNLPGFTWEDYDFAVEQPIGGVCTANKVAIYRSFRPIAGGKTANHRYSTSYESYVASANEAYEGEGLAFCATIATDVKPLASADCGTFYYPGVRVTYQSLNNEGKAESWVRVMGAAKVTFNGSQAQPIVDQYATGATKTVMLAETAETWSDLGNSSQDNMGLVQIYYSRPTLFQRKMVPDQKIDIDRYAIYNPFQNFGSPQQTGNITLVGTEAITVPAGTYKACKFTSQINTNYAAISRTDVTLTTTWVVPNVGMVKMQIEESTSSAFGGSPPTTMTEVNAVAVQDM